MTSVMGCHLSLSTCNLRFAVAVQRRIQGTLQNFQTVFGYLLDAQEYAVAVQGAEGDGLQNKQSRVPCRRSNGLSMGRLALLARLGSQPATPRLSRRRNDRGRGSRSQ
jgi:hypothetical protein